MNRDLKYAGEPTRVEIGDRNRIRESVTIHRGTVQGGGLTKVGSDNLLMINAHVAHDCTVGNRCISPTTPRWQGTYQSMILRSSAV